MRILDIRLLYKRTSLLKIFFLISFFICSSANGLEFEQAKLKNQFVENVHSEVNVSGNIIVGVMISSAYQGLQNDRIVLIPTTFKTEQEVCLHVISRDGSYSSKNTYLIKTNQKNYKELPYHSNYKEIISRFVEHDAAISITANACDKSSFDYLLPATIDNNEKKLLPGTLVIYVNGFDATDVYYETLLNGSKVSNDCDYITKGRHTAYNFICLIDLKEHSNHVLPISILREVYGRELPSIKIEIMGDY